MEEEIDTSKAVNNQNSTIKSSNGPEKRILTVPSKATSNGGADNEEANLICRVHDTLFSNGSRITYIIKDILGVGTFGQVFRCQKEGTTDVVAVKVIKNKAAYHSQGMIEISIIKLLNKNHGMEHIVHMEESFECKGHICIVFELLSISLLDVLTENKFRGLPLTQVQHFTKQIVSALVTLESANVIHCDMKPENILLSQPRSESVAPSSGTALDRKTYEETEGSVDPSYQPATSLGTDSSIDMQSIAQEMSALQGDSSNTAVRGKSANASESTKKYSDLKIIDFGSACFEGNTVYSYIQSRFYRSPEVLLGVPYNGAIDVWSLACVSVEMYLGLPLFPGVSQHNQLSRICSMMGTPPDVFLEGKNGGKYFRKIERAEGAVQYRLKTPEEYAAETGTEIPALKKYLRYDKLDEVIMKCPLADKAKLSLELKQEEMLRRACYLDFLNGLFRVNPFERWTAKQAASHPFITGAVFSEPHRPVADPKVNERKLAFLLAMQRRGISGPGLVSICKTTPCKTVPSDRESIRGSMLLSGTAALAPEKPLDADRPRLTRGQPVAIFKSNSSTSAAATMPHPPMQMLEQHVPLGIPAAPTTTTRAPADLYHAYSAVSPQATAWLHHQQAGFGAHSGTGGLESLVGQAQATDFGQAMTRPDVNQQRLLVSQHLHGHSGATVAGATAANRVPLEVVASSYDAARIYRTPVAVAPLPIPPMPVERRSSTHAPASSGNSVPGDSGALADGLRSSLATRNSAEVGESAEPLADDVPFFSVEE